MPDTICSFCTVQSDTMTFSLPEAVVHAAPPLHHPSEVPSTHQIYGWDQIYAAVSEENGRDVNMENPL